ncbi:MAG: hypothetical protein P8P49_10705, partial [Opitutales bacterium]|nr:hypothetical protein [Opitutales bacterium]
MPKPAPSSHSKSLRTRFGVHLAKIFLPWSCLGLLVFALFKKSENLVRSTAKENKEVISQNSVEKYQYNTLEKTVKKPESNLPIVSNNAEWCEAEKYQDLSKHTAIVSFENWLQTFEAFQCFEEMNCEHDPRIKWELIKKGENFAKDRAPVFRSIIQNDPRKALELAVDENWLTVLPEQISQHLESWVSSYTDIKALHICKDPNRPMGMIKRFANLPDGQTVEIHTYGNRKFLKTTKGVAIWGVKLGDDVAISENALQINPSANPQTPNAFEVKIAGMQLEVPTEKGLEILKKRIVSAERRGYNNGQVRYPLIASSGGSLNLIDLRYRVITNRLTWKEAQQVAFEQNASLVN